MSKKIFFSFLIFFILNIILNPVIYAKYVIEETIIAVNIDIDKTNPYAIINYSSIESGQEKVTVTLTLNEPIQEIEGWEAIDDNVFIKTYEENIIEDIIITDLAGNEGLVKINIQNLNNL